MDNKAQMMIIETVTFAATIFIALMFLYQLAPTSTLTNEYTKELEIRGDDALRNLYSKPITPDSFPTNYPSNKLVYYLITNDYLNCSSDLYDYLPNIVIYNIWISNGTKTIFWCDSNGNYNIQFQSLGSVTTSHCIIAIDPIYLDNSTGIFSGEYHLGKYDYGDSPRSDLYDQTTFQGYDGSTYKVILEMWRLP